MVSPNRPYTADIVKQIKKVLDWPPIGTAASESANVELMGRPTGKVDFNRVIAVVQDDIKSLAAIVRLHRIERTLATTS
jgi:hypothetical protein